MARASEENEGQIAFLVDDTREVFVVIEPRRGRLLCETLYPTKCEILNEESVRMPYYEIIYF